MEIRINALTPETFLTLYSSVGWEPPDAAQVETAPRHTPASFLACDGEKPVGMVRLIGDGGMSFYIKDFAVLPEVQSKGVGRQLLRGGSAAEDR